MTSKRIPILVAAALIAGPACATAQTARRIAPDSGITMAETPTPISGVLDVLRHLAAANGLMISGDTAGTTQVVIQGHAPAVGIHLVHLEHAKAADLAPQSQRLLTASRIVAEQSSNALLVRTTDSDWKLIRVFIQAVDL